MFSLLLPVLLSKSPRIKGKEISFLKTERGKNLSALHDVFYDTYLPISLFCQNPSCFQYNVLFECPLSFVISNKRWSEQIHFLFPCKSLYDRFLNTVKNICSFSFILKRMVTFAILLVTFTPSIWDKY